MARASSRYRSGGSVPLWTTCPDGLRGALEVEEPELGERYDNVMELPVVLEGVECWRRRHSSTDADRRPANAGVFDAACGQGAGVPVVFLVGMEEDIFPSPVPRPTDQLEEELCLCYVGHDPCGGAALTTAVRSRRL